MKRKRKRYFWCKRQGRNRIIVCVTDPSQVHSLEKWAVTEFIRRFVAEFREEIGNFGLKGGKQFWFLPLSERPRVIRIAKLIGFHCRY